MSSEARVVVPPFLKVVSGPLLGPAMLVGAARAAGHGASAIDLNATWLGEHLPPNISGVSSPFVGDHDRPSEPLRDCERLFMNEWLSPFSGMDDRRSADLLSMRKTHGEAMRAAKTLSRSRLGEWIRSELSPAASPTVVGVSVMYSGQVLAAMVTSIVARSLWPSALILWGGPHVTALCHEIVADARYGELVDRFVFGYAERTWIEVLDAIGDGRALPAAAVQAGVGPLRWAVDDPTVVPYFEQFAVCSCSRPTLPAQMSRGCAYGRCNFCTYPFVEGTYRELPLEPTLAMLERAVAGDCAVSFKDSLMVPDRLLLMARRIKGRVPWSACTKLSRKFNAAFLRNLAHGGCATLEIGLETLSPDGQLVIDKRQTWGDFNRFVEAAADAGIALVVNYMTGLPGVRAGEEEAQLSRVHDVLAAHTGLPAKVEHNVFQLERRSRMMEKTGLIRVAGEWPWSSVLDWEPSL